MGYNTTVLVLNDALDQIAKDRDFGKTLHDAVIRLSIDDRGIYIPAGCHCNAAMAIETHHADSTTLVAIGGNGGEKYSETYGWNLSDKHFKIRLLKEFASTLGYTVSKNR